MLFLPFIPAIACGVGAVAASLLAVSRHQPAGRDPSYGRDVNGSLAVIAVGLAILCAICLLWGLAEVVMHTAGERIGD